MTRLRVLHVGKFYPPSRGGMEKVLQVLCEAERAVVDSRALVANETPATVQEDVHSVPVTRAGTWRKVGSVAVCPSLPFWMRRLRGDITVIHEPNPVALVAHALARPKGPLVVWFHAEVVRPQWRYRAFYRPFLRRVLKQASRIIVASPPVAQQASELQDFRDKCVTIPYSLDPAQYAMTNDVRARAQEIRAEHADPIVLFVGRMVPYKGVDVLLRAMTGVQARAVLVGTGPLKGAWEALAADLGIADRVTFVGEATQSELVALYHACDLFVLPSVTRAEAFGMVQIEAMACGKPVISTNLPSGVPWVNTHDETGLVVAPGDVDALQHAIQALLEDPGRRAELGERGRARVQAEFSIDRMMRQTTALYCELVRPGELADAASAARSSSTQPSSLSS